MKKTKGFTLVELLVVIAILAILATVSVVGYTSFIDSAKNSVAQQELTQIKDYALGVDMTDGNKNGKIDADEVAIAFAESGFGGSAIWNADKSAVKYSATNGGVAYWTLASGKVETSAPGSWTDGDSITAPNGGTEGGEGEGDNGNAGAGEGEGNNGNEPAEPTLAASISFDNETARTSCTKDQQVWETNGLKLTNNKASSSTDVGNYADPVRFYKDSEVIIEYTGMKKLVINSSENNGDKKYFTWIKTAITNAVGNNGTVTSEGTVITIVFNSACDSFTFNSTQGQTRMVSIAVYK